MSQEHPQPLVDNTYLLEKFPVKGGWTYAAIPEITKDKHAHFGMVKVRGTIDGFKLDGINLLPLRNGIMFLSVNATIRKEINKKVGDSVHLVLYSDRLPEVVPEDFMICLKEEPTALKQFEKLSIEEQKSIIDWIYSVKTDEVRVERIIQSINKLTPRK